MYVIISIMNLELPKNKLLETSEILEFVKTHYSIQEPLSCTFIRRGFNDHYEISADDKKYIFHVYLNGKYYAPNFENFRFELDLLEFVHSKGVPVSYPIRQANGELMATLNTDSGKRAAALFSFAPGSTKHEELPTLEQCQQYGRAMAAFHLAANNFHSAHARYHLDLEYLVEQPLKMIAERGSEDHKKELESIPNLDELINAIKTLSKDPDAYGIIHGDLHPGNMHFTQDNAVTFFDFDHCAYGWRAYDFFMVGYMPETHKQALLQSYESLRPLTETERQSIDVFSKVRILWDMGDILAMKPLIDEHNE